MKYSVATGYLVGLGQGIPLRNDSLQQMGQGRSWRRGRGRHANRQEQSYEGRGRGRGGDQLGTCGNREKDGELGCQAVQASSPDSSQ